MDAYYGIDGDQGPDGDRGPSLPGSKGFQGATGQPGRSLPGPRGRIGIQGRSYGEYRIGRQDVGAFLAKMGITRTTFEGKGAIRFDCTVAGGNVVFGNIMRSV